MDRIFNRKRLCAQILILLSVLLLTACPQSKKFDAHRVKYQQEAGLVNVSVTMVASWEEYVDALQPEYKITPKEARAAVIPRTTVLEEKLVDALGFKAKVGLEQDYVEFSETKTLKGGERTKESTKTETTKKGEIPEDSAIPATPKKEAKSLAGIQEKDKVVSLDPMLEYQAGAALYQEVQLLSRYIKNAALRHNYQPYVVRLQLTVLPFARNQPYDVYTTFGFFPYSTKEGTDKKIITKAAVVPLLVTDNLEGALRSRSVDKIRQLALALGAVVQGISAEVGISKLNEELTNILGTDINSLLTVSQVTDGTIQVRLGAARQPSSEYAMIPRNHNISFLLLVPKDALKPEYTPHVKVIARSIMRDAIKGTALELDTDYKEELNKHLESVHLGPKFTATEVGNLEGKIYTNDFNGFREIIDRKINPHKYKDKNTETGKINNNSDSGAGNEKQIVDQPTHSRELWMKFTASLGSSSFSGTTFDLPRPAVLEIPKDQSVLLLDNGKFTQATLIGGEGLISFQLTGKLKLQISEQKYIPLITESITVQPGGKNPSFKFPSLKEWKIIEQINREKFQLKASSLCVYIKTDHKYGDLKEDLKCYAPVYYMAKEAAKKDENN